MARTKSKKQKTFLAVYLGSQAAMKKWNKLPAKVRQEREATGIEAWRAWARKNKKSIAYTGGPLGVTKRIDRKGIANTHNMMGAFNIVRASSHAAAAKLFRKHPHFMILPGEKVEVMEIMPIPR